MVIVRDVPAFVARLQGERLYVPAMVAVFTGMRLAEVLALRWNCVDLDRGVIQVREALEWTKAHGLRFKTPKSKAGRRDITLPDVLVDVLREHRKAALELRMQLGAGRLPDDALLFAQSGGRATTAEQRIVRLGRVRRAHRHAGGHVPRAAAHARQPTNRERRGYRHHQQALGARPPERHTCGLRAHVP